MSKIEDKSPKCREDLFRHTVGMLRYGEAEKELTEKLHECITRAQTSGKTTELTLKIKIKPRQNTGQYIIEDDVTAKLPKVLKEETLLFGTPDGNLQREDPRQKTFEFREVNQEKRPESFREIESPVKLKEA